MKEVNPAPASASKVKKLFLVHDSFVPEINLTSVWQLQDHAEKELPLFVMDLVIEGFKQSIPEIILLHTRNIKSRMKLVEDDSFNSYCFLALVDNKEGNERRLLSNTLDLFIKNNGLQSSYYNVMEYVQ